MTVKAKRFRIGVEGATTDGREIQREWLEQMAASYNPTVYTALINLEHIKSYLPDSTFNRYGKVTALFAEEITEGPLAGKMALYADVEPTESLVELVKKGQKLFTSMEVSPKFADTGKAYLVGLAATDDPASLGTEMLTFSASAAHNPLANRKQNPANLFTAAEETVIELEEIQDDKPSLFARVTALFTKKERSDDARFSDVHKAVELVATEQQNLSARTEKSLSEQEERLSELETALQAQLAQTCSGISDLQVPLRDLWNPATCPVSFLPYLAWAFSVDRWDEGWTESVKRQVVKDAFYIHQHKGTTSAVRRVVEPFGFLIRIIEWWQTGEAPGTFRLDIGVQDQGITEDTYLELERLISDAKPCSRHMIGMSINLQTSGPHWVGAASYLGEEITIYPYINETIISGGTAHEGGAVHVIDTMRVNP